LKYLNTASGKYFDTFFRSKSNIQAIIIIIIIIIITFLLRLIVGFWAQEGMSLVRKMLMACPFQPQQILNNRYERQIRNLCVTLESAQQLTAFRLQDLRLRCAIGW
jgi:hypothetical protein